MPPSIADQVEDFFDDIKDAFGGNHRQLNVKSLATAHQWNYTKRKHLEDFDYAVRSLRFFQNKKRTRIQHVLDFRDTKTASRIEIFDIGNRGGNKKVSTCCLIESALLNLPRFLLRPKKTIEKMTSVFASSQTLLAKFPELQKQYTMQAKHPEYMHGYLTEQWSEHLLSMPLVTVEGLDGWLLIYAQQEQWEVTEIPDLADFALELTRIMLFDHSNDLV